MFGKGFVDKDCLLTGARVDTNDRMYCLDGSSAEDTTTTFLQTFLGLLHSRVESCERLKIFPERWREFPVGCCHADILSVTATLAGDG